MKRTFTILLILFVSALLLTGCVYAQDTREFTDSLGRVIQLPETLTSVSPSGPLAQIVLYTMSPDCFVTVSSKLDDAERKYLDKRLAGLPVTGQFYGSKSTMNTEEIMQLNKELNIDVVLDIGQVKRDMAKDLDTIQSQTGVDFAFITMDKVHDMPKAYITLGSLLGMEEQGSKISKYISDLIDEFDAGMKKVGDKKVSLIYVTSVDGNAVNLIGSGEKSYHGEIVNFIADNAAPAAVTGSGRGDPYTTEDILGMNPDYIIVGYEKDHRYYNEIMKSNVWKNLKAVKNGNVYEAPFGPYSWMGNPPSVNKLLSLIWLGNLFYPDVFDYDLQTEITEFYNLFFHYNLTDDEYDELTLYSLPESSKSSASSPAPIFGVIAALSAACLILRRF